MEETTEIRNICEQIAQVYRDKMSNADYDPNGELMKFTWVTEYNGNLFELYFNLPDYWYYAENGRRPGKFPPPDKILRWIQFKRIVPSSHSGKIPSTNQLVYLISRKIALKGTEGKHLFEKTLDDPNLDKLADKLVELITTEFEKEIEKEIQNIIK